MLLRRKSGPATCWAMCTSAVLTAPKMAMTSGSSKSLADIYTAPFDSHFEEERLRAASRAGSTRPASREGPEVFGLLGREAGSHVRAVRRSNLYFHRGLRCSVAPGLPL